MNEFSKIKKYWRKRICIECRNIGRGFYKLSTPWESTDDDFKERLYIIYCKDCLKKWQKANSS